MSLWGNWRENRSEGFFPDFKWNWHFMALLWGARRPSCGQACQRWGTLKKQKAAFPDPTSPRGHGSDVSLHNRDDERRWDRQSACHELLAHLQPLRSRKKLTFPASRHLSLLSSPVGAAQALYRIPMMVNIVPRGCVWFLERLRSETCSFSFTLDMVRCLHSLWFTEIVTSLQSQSICVCSSLNSEFDRTSVECVFIWE